MKSSTRNNRQQTNDDLMSEMLPAQMQMPIVDPFMHSQDSSKKLLLNPTPIVDTMPDQESSVISVRKGSHFLSLTQNPSEKKQANIIIRNSQPKKRKHHINQFKEKQMQDKEVIEFLQAFCQTKINLTNINTPNDFDSTDNLDSFLMALLSVNQDQLSQIDSHGLDNIHLATGTRTGCCRSIVQALIEFQNKELVFQDALEFFEESMVKVVQIAAENHQRSVQIEGLEQVKQDLTIKMFDYQKKLTDTSTALLKLRQTEFEQAKVLAAVKKQLDHKKAECESLTYMIKNNTKQEPLTLDLTEKPSRRESARNTSHNDRPEVDLPIELPSQNQTILILQQQIQKLSIENRQNLDKISELQVAFEGKDKLIAHLEHNISEILVEKEKNVIRLKSEIVVLQNKVQESEENYKTKLLQMKLRVEVDEKAKVKRQTEALNEKYELSLSHNQDLEAKIQRMNAEQQSVNNEFISYRKEKVIQDNQRETYLQEIESKYRILSEQYSQSQRDMLAKLDTLTAQSQQRQSENEVLYLRLKYLKQITDTLKRQKLFIQESLSKARSELAQSMFLLEEAMVNQNKSKSYLISVEKSIKQTKEMSEQGQQALHDIENIVKFLKVEKMHELVFDVETPTSFEQDNATLHTLNSRQTSNLKLEAQKPVVHVQTMLDGLKLSPDLPVQFRPKVFVRDIDPKKQKIVKNEEYYIEHCPIELCSILLKFIAQELVKVEVVQTVEQLPFTISRLLFVANAKSDLLMEKELFDTYLVETKRILDEEIGYLHDQISTLGKLKEIQPIRSRNLSAQADSTTHQYNVLSLKAFEKQSMTQDVEPQRSQRSSHHDEVLDELSSVNARLQKDIEKLQMSKVETKKRHKEVQIGLATEIVELQERIEQLQYDHEVKLYECETAYRHECEKVKQGCLLREQTLLKQLEQKMSHSVSKHEIQQVEVKALSPQLSQPVLDAPSVELVQDSVQDQVKHLTEKLEAWQANVMTYIEVKESCRNTVSIVFERNEANLQMISNEHIIKLYFSKIFMLAQEKIVVLSTDAFVREETGSKVRRQEDTIMMTKITIEIIEERNLVEAKFAQLRADVNDGSSLLFDLMPSYICFNLGQSGLGTKNKLSECRLLQKKGLTIEGVEHIVTLVRHKTDPFIFMVIAVNVQQGDEYVLELNQQDIRTLIEGDQSLLENNDAISVQETILLNLVLLCGQQGQKLLACEQKVYFNTVMQSIMTSKASSTAMQNQKGENPLKQFDTKMGVTQLKSSIYALSTVRDMNLATIKSDKVQLRYNKMHDEQQTQTDFQVSSLYQAFETIYQSLHKVSDNIELCITIEQSIEAIKIQFQDLKSFNKVQICLITDDFDAYFTHSHCLIVEEAQVVICSVERLHHQGLLLKLHDLKLQQSCELVLLTKTNGQLSKHSFNPDLMPSETFRQMVFDLSYNPVTQDEQQLNQTIAQSYLQIEDKLVAESRNPQLAQAELMLEVTSHRQSAVVKMPSKAIVMDALKSENNLYARHAALIESQKQLQERGLLLFREVMYVRVSESLAQEAVQFDDCSAVLALCSMHIKDKTLNIEVFLYEKQKILITSLVDCDQLFLGDPLQLSQAQRAKFIQQILEKLFVVEIDGRYEMKIEQEAANMQEIIDVFLETHGGMPGQTNLDQIVKSKSQIQRNYEEKQREFQIEKQGYVSSGRAVYFTDYVIISSTLEVFELKIYVLTKESHPQQARKLQTYGKSQVQIQSQKLEHFMEDCCDIEAIYIETADPATKDAISILLDQKRIVEILVKDITTDWAALLGNWRTALVPYIKQTIQIDTQTQKITLRNDTDITNIIIANCSSTYGSKTHLREDSAVIETFKQQCEQLVDKTLVLNQEVDMAEFSYDIKMYRICQKTVNEFGGHQTYAYHVEVFNVNEPNHIFTYRLPLTEKKNDPLTFVSEVFNLVNFELKEEQNKQTQLVRRYVDNNLILTMQHSKFPAMISLSLIEASSGLSWSADYEPSSEITSAGTFCILEPETIQQFLNSVYDSTLNSQQFQAKSKIYNDFDWNELTDAAPTDLLQSTNIDEELALSITKHRGVFKVEVTSQSYQKHDYGNNLDTIVRGEYSNDPDCLQVNHSQQLVDLRIKNVFAAHLICKVLLTATNKYIIKVHTSRSKLTVMVQDLQTMQVIIEWVLTHPAQQENSTDLPHIVVQLQDVTTHILQAIQTINNPIITNKMLKLHAQWSQHNTISPIQKSLTLYRRVFFDEQRDNLIIITAEVVVDAAVTGMFLLQDVEQFTFKLEQPDRKAQVTVVQKLTDCLGMETSSLNRKDVTRLKAFAKKVLDERTELKYNAVDEFPYSLNFVAKTIQTTIERTQSSIE